MTMTKDHEATTKKVGLDYVDDETLASLVESSQEDGAKLLTGAAAAAFAELCRRSGYAV